MSDDCCIVCGTSRDGHNDNIRHTFTPPGMRVDVSQFDRKRSIPRNPSVDERQQLLELPETIQAPLDPILRLALINKGVLTINDIESAERMFRGITYVAERTNDSESPSNGS
jgi:hypothetical protein